MNKCNTPCYAGNAQPSCNNTGCRSEADTSCACPKSRLPANTVYAMAYVPFQQSGEVYSCDKALSRGTIFPCLDLPFLKGCCK